MTQCMAFINNVIYDTEHSAMKTRCQEVFSFQNAFFLTFLERSSDFSLLNSSYRLPWWYLESPVCARRVVRTLVFLFIFEFHWFLIHFWIIPESLLHALNLPEGFLFQKSKNIHNFFTCYSSSETYMLFI